MANNVLDKVAYLNHKKAEDAEDRLEGLVKKQEGNLDKKRNLRRVQEQFDAVKADGKATGVEMWSLAVSMQENGISGAMKAVDTAYNDKIWVSDPDGNALRLRSDDPNDKLDDKADVHMKRFETLIKNAIDDASDEDRKDGFITQQGVNDLTHAQQNATSSADKQAKLREEQSKKVWG